MKLIRIGLGKLDPTVGALRSNTDAIIKMAAGMMHSECTIGCFAEHAISGYPVEDLVFWPKFVDEQWEELLRFAEATHNANTVFVVGLAVAHRSLVYNAAAVVYGGSIVGVVPKEKLPTYNVFDDKRTYTAGIPGYVDQLDTDPPVPFGDLIFEFPFGIMAVEVCEDIWSPDGPMRRRAYSKAELFINVSASPFRAGVDDTRRQMISTRASDNLATVVYVNQYGGNDSLVFDGGGFINQCGRMEVEAPRWCEGLTMATVDLDATSRQRRENTTWRSDCETFLRTHQPVRTIKVATGVSVNFPSYGYPAPEHGSFFIPPKGEYVDHRSEYFDDLVSAMITGLDGYFRKTKAFKRIGIALSGGKDSVLTLLVAYLWATKKLGKKPEEIADLIHCFSFPTEFNSANTKDIAREVGEALHASFAELSIAEEFAQTVVDVEAMLPVGQRVTGLSRKNIQARIRGKRMWDWSNNMAGLWLQTGNMSEKAVGYTTIGGDMMGGYSLIGNLPKTVVIELIEYLNGKIFKLGCLDRLLQTEASAELADNQSDEKDLMPFPILDACMYLFAGEKMSREEVLRVIDQMFSAEYKDSDLETWVDRFVDLFGKAIFKWEQAPQAVHLGSLDLDRSRALQLPVVSSDEWR
jgi:NAD+ synthase (glutamine-hydrolysing)